MPCAVQPGRISGKMRARYTARRKVALLASARQIQEEEGLSLRAAADRLGVSHSLIVRWQLRDAGVVDPLVALLRGKKILPPRTHRAAEAPRGCPATICF